MTDGSTVDAAAIVRNSISLAHQLDLRTVAEGVEDERSWHLLREAGCDAVFLPQVSDIWRPGAQTHVQVTQLGGILMGYMMQRVALRWIVSFGAVMIAIGTTISYIGTRALPLRKRNLIAPTVANA